MAIPLHGQVEVPLLMEIAKLGGSAVPQQVYDALGKHFQLSDYERYQLTTNDGESRSLWENHVRQVRRTLVQKGEVDNSVRGRWSITPAGYNRLQLSGFITNSPQKAAGSSTTKSGSRVAKPVTKTPEALDLSEPAEATRTLSTTYRILRDTALARKIKEIHNFECQLCGDTIYLANEQPYIEAHHIKPLGSPHNGPDIAANIICVCPNHHVQLDYGAIQLHVENLILSNEHIIGDEYINYHNTEIFGK